mmetsp:Transcript_41733/g.124806  ORF Transcript_41733/g.124806 Transcript_41733/m.124806 type:complete len:289 (-) Transcript_41733:2777-3643(-)
MVCGRQGAAASATSWARDRALQCCWFLAAPQRRWSRHPAKWTCLPPAGKALCAWQSRRARTSCRSSRLGRTKRFQRTCRLTDAWQPARSRHSRRQPASRSQSFGVSASPGTRGAFCRVACGSTPSWARRCRRRRCRPAVLPRSPRASCRALWTRRTRRSWQPRRSCTTNTRPSTPPAACKTCACWPRRVCAVCACWPGCVGGPKRSLALSVPRVVHQAADQAVSASAQLAWASVLRARCRAPLGRPHRPFRPTSAPDSARIARLARHVSRPLAEDGPKLAFGCEAAQN